MRAILIIVAMLLLSGTVQSQRLVPVGEGSVGPFIEKIVEFNGELIIGGWINNFNGLPIKGLLSWDGNTSVTQLGPFANFNFGATYDLLIHQGKLVIAYSVGQDNYVATWDGMIWSQLGPVFDQKVLCIMEFDGELYAGGEFGMIGADAAAHIARWDGVNWSPLGNGTDGRIFSMVVHDGELMVAGDFSSAGTTQANNLARWDGTSWSGLGVGLNSRVEDLASVSGELWVVGLFSYNSDSTLQLNGSARWNGSQFDVLANTPLTSQGSRIVDIPGVGIVLTDQYKAIYNIPNGEEWINLPAVRSAADFNGSIYCGGAFQIRSYRTVNRFGKLLPGVDLHKLKVAGVEARISPLWDLWPDINGPGFQVPIGSGNYSLNATGICAAAKVGSTLRVTPFFQHSQLTDGVEPGPWCTDTSYAFKEAYHQVWPIDNGAVWNHVDSWNSPGYTLPYVLGGWPANGDQSNGEPAQLAPFNDANGNGTYEPELGEAPIFPGDAAIYTIRSDQHTQVWDDGREIGLDLHAFTHGYNVASSDPRYQVMFMQHKIINRSANDLDTLWLGSMTDIDLALMGYGGCDTTLNMAYGYIGDTVEISYGEHPPAIGVISLNSELHSFIQHTNSGAINGDPRSDTAFYYYLNGRWQDGSEVIDLNGNATRYMYYGDPAVAGAYTALTVPGPLDDRRLLASYGPFYHVAPGDTICLDLAYVFAQDTLGDNISSVTLLKQRAAAVQAWYDQNAQGCGEYIVLGVDDTTPSALEFSLYPNPSSGSLVIERPNDEPATIAVLSVLGSIVAQEQFGRITRKQMDLSDLSDGTYLVRIESETGVGVKRLVVARQ